MELRSKRAPQLDFSIGHVRNSGANHYTRPNPIQMAGLQSQYCWWATLQGQCKEYFNGKCVLTTLAGRFIADPQSAVDSNQFLTEPNKVVNNVSHFVVIL